VSLIRFKAQNHPQQAVREDVDDRGTTVEVFQPLMDRYGFTVDVAAAEHNAKLSRFYTIQDDGLAQSWTGERVWCNPPYSDIRSWVEKAWTAWASGTDLIVMLLPANRTEQSWWQELVEPYRDSGRGLRVEFMRGRIRFDRPNVPIPAKGDRPPFGSCLLIWAAGEL
jgi:phage N-6-adenine-methyltransferase